MGDYRLQIFDLLDVACWGVLSSLPPCRLSPSLHEAKKTYKLTKGWTYVHKDGKHGSRLLLSGFMQELT